MKVIGCKQVVVLHLQTVILCSENPWWRMKCTQFIFHFSFMDPSALFYQIIFPTSSEKDDIPLGGGGTNYASFRIRNDVKKIVPNDPDHSILTVFIKTLNSKLPSLSNTYCIWPQSKIEAITTKDTSYYQYTRPYAPLLLSSYLKFPCFRFLTLSFFLKIWISYLF